MGPRTRKLVAAGAVVLAGLVVSWPLRLQDERPSTAIVGGLPLAAAPLAGSPPESSASLAAAAPLGAALPIATDNEPAVAATLVRARTAETLAGPIDAGELAADRGAAAPGPIERIHVVHEGDSLERLAKRYLGDETRALEIFDLNRRLIENPHLLPIGAELRIPPPPTSAE